MSSFARHERDDPKENGKTFHFFKTILTRYLHTFARPGWDASQQQPEPECELEKEDRPTVVSDADDSVELGEDNEAEGTKANPYRCNHSEGCQWSRDVAGLEPQVTEDRRAKTKQDQSNSIRGVVRPNAHARERRDAGRVEA